ncbi:MAG: putative peptidyl-prolyl cis-trans isomerase [Frankiales bacterium]|nr:putative peptidyl-prolyl cis-trans isomerase [Frankiales bacterium]
MGVLLLTAAAKVVTGSGGGASATATPSPTKLACVYRADGTTNSRVITRPTPPGFGTRRNGVATMVTNHGTVEFALLTSDAPCAVRSFAFLASKKYFDGSTCSRLTTGGLQFLQCGDPVKGTGPGYEFPDENLSPSTTYPTGTVAMANHGPNTNGSEFFLCYGDTQLPPQFVPFGRITSGLAVLGAIARAGAPAGDGAPRSATTIVRLSTTGT